MDEKNHTNDPNGQAREPWRAPELTTHGDFAELTRFTSGTGPDDGFFDPGAGTSAA